MTRGSPLSKGSEVRGRGETMDRPHYNQGWSELPYRDIEFWGTPELGLLMESGPDDPISIAFYAQFDNFFVEPLITVFGFPDFEAVRKERYLSLEDVAKLWNVSTDAVRMVELGWHAMTIKQAMWCCRRLNRTL
jgi:hypothetical protein